MYTFRNRVTLFSFILTVMVIFVHAVYPDMSALHADSGLLGAYYLQTFLGTMVCGVAVPGFFCISGYLFFRGLGSGTTSAETDLTQTAGHEGLPTDIILSKWRRRVRSLVVPFIVWNLIYFFIYLAAGRAELSAGELIRAVIDYSYNPVFWYLRELIILTVLAPVIYLFIRRRAAAAALTVILFLLATFYEYIPVHFVNEDALFYYTFGASAALWLGDKVEDETPLGGRKDFYMKYFLYGNEGVAGCLAGVSWVVAQYLVYEGRFPRLVVIGASVFGRIAGVVFLYCLIGILMAVWDASEAGTIRRYRAHAAARRAAALAASSSAKSLPAGGPNASSSDKLSSCPGASSAQPDDPPASAPAYTMSGELAASSAQSLPAGGLAASSSDKLSSCPGASSAQPDDPSASAPAATMSGELAASSAQPLPAGGLAASSSARFSSAGVSTSAGEQDTAGVSAHTGNQDTAVSPSAAASPSSAGGPGASPSDKLSYGPGASSAQLDGPSASAPAATMSGELAASSAQPLPAGGLAASSSARFSSAGVSTSAGEQDTAGVSAHTGNQDTAVSPSAAASPSSAGGLAASLGTQDFSALKCCHDSMLPWFTRYNFFIYATHYLVIRAARLAFGQLRAPLLLTETLGYILLPFICAAVCAALGRALRALAPPLYRILTGWR